jgi:glucokinase
MSRGNRVAVGLEISGGQATIALVDSLGKVRSRCQAKTLRGRPAIATLEPYMRGIDAMITRAYADGLDICGIGVSIPGSIDYTSRRPLIVSLLPSLNGFPLYELFSSRYRIPVDLHADVDAAILGEYRFGAGRDCQRLLFLTVNAVVGAAFVVDGQVVRSTHQHVGHVCHVSVATSGPRCSCGKRGCINTLISIDAMQRLVQRALRRGDETTLTQRFLNREFFSHQVLAEEAANGDPVAKQVYNELARWLSVAITRYVELFDPHMLILGGGVLAASDLLLPQVRSTMNASFANGNTATCVCPVVDVVPACLGSDASLIGCTASLF